MNNSNTGKQFGSSDEQKFSFEDEISYSQEMMQDLSVHGTKAAELRLEENFIKSLNEREKEAMKKLGIFTISLSVHQKNIILGRDQFKVVFGDKIGGHDISILSRKHCIFHISSDAASKMIVTVENTSTNGIEVNKRSIETGEPVRLHHGDVITLLRVHQGPKEVSLDYVLFDPDHSRSPVKKKSKALSRPSSSAPNELHHGLPLPPPTGERTPPKESQADLDLINPRIPRVTLQQRPTSAASSIFSNSSVTFLGGIVNLSVLVSDPIMRSSVQGSSIDFGSAFSGLLSTTRLKMEKSHATAELLDRSIKNDSNQVVLLSGIYL
jgi:hypothetical protein